METVYEKMLEEPYLLDLNNEEQYDFELLKKRCWNLTVEYCGSLGWCSKFCNRCYQRQNCSKKEVVAVRHTNVDKNGRHYAIGKRYCIVQLVKERFAPFADSEIHAMLRYLGVFDKRYEFMYIKSEIEHKKLKDVMNNVKTE